MTIGGSRESEGLAPCEWDVFDKYPENTCTCQCGAVFRSHSRCAMTGASAPAHLELKSRKPCPRCGLFNNLAGTSSDPETVTINRTTEP